MELLLSISALMGAVCTGHLLATRQELRKQFHSLKQLEASWQEALKKFADTHNSLATKVAELEDKAGANAASLDYIRKGRQL